MFVSSECSVPPEDPLCQEMFEKRPHCSKTFTAIAFICTLISAPFIILFYFISKIIKKSWVGFLSVNFPNMLFVEPDSVGTLMDTHRNQGIINVLMTLRGRCDPEVVKEALEEHIVERRTKKGHLLYPVLRFRLFSCWGNYAWKESDDFDIKNHLITGSSKYRGRPVTEHNLQEYVSGITSKFLLNTQPPWQVIIIPNIASREPTYGLLIRVHHLILEEGPLSIGDFLCLKQESEQFIGQMDSDMEEFDTKTPLNDVIKPPLAVSILWSRLSDSLSNHWNEFVSDFDPITSPELFKKNPGFFDFMARIVIVFVSAYRDTKKYIEISERPRRIHYYLRALSYERKKRKITLSSFFLSLFITFNPVYFILKVFRTFLWIFIAIFIKLPYQLYQEFLAIKSSSDQRVCALPNTLTSFVYDYLPLFYEAAKELYYIGSVVYSAPAVIVHEMFRSNRNLEEHQLQKTSSCGRKVVAWSEPVSRHHIKEIANARNVSETEILLTMVSACVKEYFHHNHLPLPKMVATYVKTLSFDKLVSTHEQKLDSDRSKGIVFMSLPMHKMCFGQCREEVRSISKELQRIIENQAGVYVLTSMHEYLSEMLPSVYERVFLNYVTRKISVNILEIVEGRYNSYGCYRKTLWNDEIVKFFYWRPPQSNVGMSLTIQRYADTVSLSVMTDSLLSPHHHDPANHWVRAAKRLHSNSQEESTHSPQGSITQQESPESQQYDQYGSSPTNSTASLDMRDFGGSIGNSSETTESNSSELQLSPTSYIYEYLLNSEYRMDDFIRDVQFDGEEG